MPDEANDKRIKEAAERYHPAYDDKAWEKMEQLLDQHLPQKKKRSGFIFFLLSLILGGGVMLFVLTENSRKDATHDRQKPASGNPEINHPTSGRNGNISEMPHPGSKNSAGAPFPNEKKWQPDLSKNNRQNLTVKDETKTLRENFTDYDTIHGNNSAAGTSSSSSVIPLFNEENILNQKENNSDNPLDKPIVNTSGDIIKTEKDEANASKAKQETKQSKNNFAGRFGINVSAGPEISGVHLDDPGKLSINIGLGASYLISPSFTLRTGFYAGTKIYSVEPEDYEITGPGNYYLENINANCLVYSIPLNINYNFVKGKNHNWFLSTGLSSYLMKRETYEYYYRNSSGQAYTKDWTINNQNKHFLSVLNLSGGYQYFFNKRISAMAEPYINLPLSGVGAGKVKLKSTGILFTFTVKPFLKKEK